MIRKKRRVWPLAAIVCLMPGCFDQTSCQTVEFPTPLPVPSTSPSPTPSPVAGCPPVVAVGISVEGHPNPLHVGETYRLDATPKGPDLEPVTPECHGAAADWSLTGTTAGCALQGDTRGFNPFVKCMKAGQLVATACVDGVCSGELRVEVVA